MLPGQNIFPREVPEEEQKVEDPLLHLYTNVANFLGVERDLHVDGVKPFEDELSLLAVLNALEILRLHGRNIFPGALEELQHEGGDRVARSIRRA